MTAVAAPSSQAVEASRRPGSSCLGSEPGPPMAPSTGAEGRHFERRWLRATLSSRAGGPAVASFGHWGGLFSVFGGYCDSALARELLHVWGTSALELPFCAKLTKVLFRQWGLRNLISESLSDLDHVALRLVRRAKKI